MKIFITGASGFVGGAIGTRLKQDHEIHAMARSEVSAEKVKALGFTPIRTALNKVKVDDLKGCDVVIHSAAFVEAWGTEEQFMQANVEGTRQLLEMARTAGIKKFIHIGTEACLFYGQRMIDIDETYPYAFHSPYLYSKTKAKAEKLVLDANEVGIFETISIRPRMVWGPGDQTILPEVLKLIRKGSFAWVKEGKSLTSTTHIDNLVHGVVLALEKGRAGEAYFVTDDDDRTMKEFFSQLVGTQSVTIPPKSVPPFILRPLAKLVEGTYRLIGAKSEPPITRFAADMMCVDCTINIDKAKKELGYSPIMSIEKGMKQLTKIN